MVIVTGKQVSSHDKKRSRVGGYGKQGCGIFMPAYASSAVGDVLADGAAYGQWKLSPVPRKLVRLGLCGGAAIADAEVDVFFGAEQIAHLINFQTGAPDKTKWFWFSSQKVLPANVPLTAKVTNAFTSTKTFLLLDLREVFTPRRF